jgi:hypothetical protein
MTSIDKDFRFMATNDLMNELQNDSIKLDDDSERKVCFKDKDFSFKIKKIYLNKIVKTLLKLLEDKNGGKYSSS